MRKIKAYKKPFTVDAKLYAYLRYHTSYAALPANFQTFDDVSDDGIANMRNGRPPCVYYQAIVHGEVSTPDGHMLSMGMRLKTELDNPDVDVIAEIGVCTNKPTENVGPTRPPTMYTELFFYNGNFYCKAADVYREYLLLSDYYNKKQYMLYKVDLANEEQFMQDFQEALAAANMR